MIEKDMRDLVVTYSELVSTKIFPLVAIEGTELPYIAITKIGEPRWWKLSGKTDFVLSRFQISLFAKSYYDAKMIEGKLRGLQDYEGGNIVNIRLVNSIDNYEHDTKIYSVFIEVEVRHYEI